LTHAAEFVSLFKW